MRLLRPAVLLIAICYTSGCTIRYIQCPQPRRGEHRKAEKPPEPEEDEWGEDSYNARRDDEAVFQVGPFRIF